MTIINNANAGSQINLICLIYRILQNSNGKYSVNEMVELCRPSNLPDSTNAEKRFKENLLFWTGDYHRLWVEKDDKLELVENLQKPTPSSIALALHNALFRIDIENIFANAHQTESLFRALGCMLACDRYTLDSEKRFEGAGRIPSMNRMFTDCFSGKTDAPNESERLLVLKYGLFFGYLETWPGNKYVVDPTRVVRNYLPNIFEKKGELEAKDFVSKLGGVLPLMDGGCYRRQIAEKMTSHAPDCSGRDLTKSLSFSLYRLEKDQTIEFIRKSDDSGAYVLQFPNNENAHFSSIRYLRGGANP